MLCFAFFFYIFFSFAPTSFCIQCKNHILALFPFPSFLHIPTAQSDYIECTFHFLHWMQFTYCPGYSIRSFFLSHRYAVLNRIAFGATFASNMFSEMASFRFHWYFALSFGLSCFHFASNAIYALSRIFYPLFFHSHRYAVLSRIAFDATSKAAKKSLILKI
jgi:hypothetical protein